MLVEVKKEVPFVIRVSEKHLFKVARAHASRILEGKVIFLKLFIGYSSLCNLGFF